MRRGMKYLVVVLEMRFMILNFVKVLYSDLLIRRVFLMLHFTLIEGIRLVIFFEITPNPVEVVHVLECRPRGSECYVFSIKSALKVFTYKCRKELSKVRSCKVGTY